MHAAETRYQCPAANPLYAEFGKLAGSMLVGKPKITPYTELDHKAKL